MKHILFIILFSLLGFTPTVCGEVNDIDIGYANHKINGFHFTELEALAFVDDGSTWHINPEDAGWIEEQKDFLLKTPFTLMPEAGTENYPVRIIIHNDHAFDGWQQFTVSQDSAPKQPDRMSISKIDHHTVTLIKNEEAIAIIINPSNADTIKQWSAGQRVIIGGTWFPEFDPVGGKEYDCAYLFTLYNYETRDFVFFTFQ